MSWRTVVVSSSAKLDYQMEYLVIRTHDTLKIHLSEISILIIENTSVSLTTSLLSELTKKKIKVIFCDEKRNPSSELVSYYGCHDTSAKIREQIKWNDSIKTLVWTEIVKEKIRQQALHLYSLNRPEEQLLLQYMREMKIGDASNREGHAAKVYFNAIFGNDFTRTADNSINAALNYGYSILLSIFNREIVSNGYLTQLALFHNNMFNYFNLGSDLMEPFRPIVDRYVYRLSPETFEKEEKQYMLNIVKQELYINGRNEYLLNAIKIYTRSVFESINNNDISLIKFYEL